MSISSADTNPDPQTIAEDFEQRLIDEEWPEKSLTTEITIWADGDCRVKVWHSLDREEDDRPVKIQYTHHPDGTIERERLE